MTAAFERNEGPDDFSAAVRGQATTRRCDSKRRSRVLIAVVLSVGVHVAALLLVVTLPHIVPTEAQPHEQGTVDLLMVEQKGAQPVQGGPPADTPAPATPPLPDADPPRAVERKDAPPTPRSVATPAATVGARRRTRAQARRKRRSQSPGGAACDRGETGRGAAGGATFAGSAGV